MTAADIRTMRAQLEALSRDLCKRSVAHIGGDAYRCARFARAETAAMTAGAALVMIEHHLSMIELEEVTQ